MHNSSPHTETVSFVNSDDIRAQIDAVYKEVSIRIRKLLGEIRIEHIGSTAILSSLTKGDLDVLCIVPDEKYEAVKSILAQHFSANLGTSEMQGFASFECDDYQVSIGIQLINNTATQPPFLQWREILLTDDEIRQEYDELKRKFNNKLMSDYRNAKEKLICKYLPDETSNEYDIFEYIKKELIRIQSKKDKPIRVAINGIEGTGKTIFAKKLAFYLKWNHLNTVHISIDGFHFKKAHRYRQGRDSAKGYYEDSYDEQAFVDKVLLSSQNEHPNYTPTIHNLENDESVDPENISLSPDAILITDGAYLFKPSYHGHWDLKIYLQTDHKTAMHRGIARDSEKLGGFDKTKEKFLKRYHAASKIYIDKCDPVSLADIVIDNTDFNKLKIIKPN